MSQPRLRLEKCRSEGGIWHIDSEQARHLTRARRLSSGSVVEGLLNGEKITLRLLDGDGELRAEEISRCREAPAPVEIHLLLAVLKAEQFDMALRFAAETGVHTIRLLSCERSVPRFDGSRLAEKMSRWRRILDESTKQAGAAAAPLLAEPVALRDLDLSALPTVRFAALLDHNAVSLVSAEAESKAAVAIGPEGDWTPVEAAFLIENGFTPVSLGSRILRASTAVAVACGALSMKR